MLRLLTQGAVFHEVANLSTDATAAIIGSHFSFSKYFRIKEILHLTGIHRRKVSDGCAKHSSAIDKSLHDEICHFPRETSTQIMIEIKWIFNDYVFGCPLLVEGGEAGMLSDTDNMLSEVKVLSVKAE